MVNWIQKRCCNYIVATESGLRGGHFVADHCANATSEWSSAVDRCTNAKSEPGCKCIKSARLHPGGMGKLVSVQWLDELTVELFLQGEKGDIYLVRLAQQGQYVYLDTSDKGGVVLVIKRQP